MTEAEVSKLSKNVRVAMNALEAGLVRIQPALQAAEERDAAMREVLANRDGVDPRLLMPLALPDVDDLSASLAALKQQLWRAGIACAEARDQQPYEYIGGVKPEGLEE